MNHTGIIPVTLQVDLFFSFSAFVVQLFAETPADLLWADRPLIWEKSSIISHRRRHESLWFHIRAQTGVSYGPLIYVSTNIWCDNFLLIMFSCVWMRWATPWDETIPNGDEGQGSDSWRKKYFSRLLMCCRFFIQVEERRVEQQHCVPSLKHPMDFYNQIRNIFTISKINN